jgi:hypothetical protein
MRKRLVVGALALAITQGYPMIHMLVGMTAMHLWQGATPGDESFAKVDAAGGAAVTAMTGGALMLTALLGGAALVAIHAAWSGAEPGRDGAVTAGAE